MPARQGTRPRTYRKRQEDSAARLPRGAAGTGSDTMRARQSHVSGVLGQSDGQRFWQQWVTPSSKEVSSIMFLLVSEFIDDLTQRSPLSRLTGDTK